MNLEMQQRVAENIKQLRNFYGYTQAEIADELHICRSTYTLYELGKKTPNTDILLDLASFYDIRVDVLLNMNTNQYVQYMFSQTRCANDILHLVKTYFQLSPHGQGRLVERADVLLEREISYNNICTK